MVLLIFVPLLLFIQISYSPEQVIVKFLYNDPRNSFEHWSPWCDPCVRALKDFLSKNETVYRIEEDYGSQVMVERLYFYSSDGQKEANSYDVIYYNSVIIRDSRGNFTTIQGDFNSPIIRDSNGNLAAIEGNFNETVRKVIDAFLVGETPQYSPWPLISFLVVAFSFGFFETFSPCLIALLSFVLSYTIGKTTQFREGLIQVMAFGTGFLSAALLIGLTVGLMFLSIPTLHYILLWIVCIFAIFFGLNLLGFDVLKSLNIKFETKPLVKKLSRKFVFTYTGLILLGFLFYFLDPCIAPIFVSMLPLLLPEYLSLILLVFSLGVIAPFIIIGILAGSISKLARNTYRHRSKVRAISGSILIAYSLYLVVFYLIL